MSTNQEWEIIWKKAVEAGRKGLIACQPRPMIVEQHQDMMDDSSLVEKQWYVEGGVCGFAWVTVRPGNCSFARWLKQQSHAKTDSYYGGVTIWIAEGGQSMERKVAYAREMARILNEHGIRATVRSRID